ncbi:MAG: transporter substrate-binding domain-containing protein [Burkholderiaceae bacterium]
MTDRDSLSRAFAPTGTLRAALNLANHLVAGSRTSTEKPAGVSVDLARELAHELGLPLDLLPFGSPVACVDALTSGQADIGFVAVDPARAAGIHFSPPYLQIEGCYLVADDSAIHRNEDVDQTGIDIAVVAGSAYALFLGRHLKRARLAEMSSSQQVMESVRKRQHPVAAGIRQMLEAEARQLAGVRLLPERFMLIQQAMAMPGVRAPQARAWLDDFVERSKRAGLVDRALQRHGIVGAQVAP